jgi:peptidoglycan-associated lipoprotein
MVSVAIAAGVGCRTHRKPVVAGPGDARAAGSGNTREPGDMTGDGLNRIPGEGGIGGDLPPGVSPEEVGPLADVRFEYDSAALTAEAHAILQKHADWIQRHPQMRFVLQGHCDERGTVEYNLTLGEQRARAVYDYLTSLGVPGARLSTVSFGKERPLDPGRGEEAWAKNRRVHFAVSG